MRDLVLIKRIAIDKNGILSVTPQKGSFDMIYRAAMSVRWYIDGRYLYFVTPISCESDILKFYNFILMAVLDEYGKILKPDNRTIYENINENIKAEIVKLGTIKR